MNAPLSNPPWQLPPPDCHTRWFTAENPQGAPGAAHLNNDGRKRNASLELAAGGELDLVEYQEGPGVITRIWLTVFALRQPDCAPALRGLRLVVWYDGADRPAINVPVGDFFCQGLGRMSVLENAFFSSPEGRSLVSTLPMPFRRGVRIKLVNDSQQACRKVYYEVDATVGVPWTSDSSYLHAHWHRENPTRLLDDYTVLPRIQGRGRFLGTCFSVIPDRARYLNTWWGEGALKIFLDGDQANPTLCGTGTEDYIGTGWGQHHFAQLHQGSPIADRTETAFAYAFYRLHVPDPVYFHRDIRVTIQQIGSWTKVDQVQALRDIGTPIHLKGGDLLPVGGEPGFSHYEREDDWSSLCWFYLDRPENDLPPPPAYESRIAGLIPAHSL